MTLTQAMCFLLHYGWTETHMSTRETQVRIEARGIVRREAEQILHDNIRPVEEKK